MPSFATLQTQTGHLLSSVCAALTNTSRAERLLSWINNSYVVQDHAAAMAGDIVQDLVLSPEPDSSLSTHPAHQIVYNTVHILIANYKVPQYIANPQAGTILSPHMYQSSFGDWA